MKNKIYRSINRVITNKSPFFGRASRKNSAFLVSQLIALVICLHTYFCARDQQIPDWPVLDMHSKVPLLFKVLAEVYRALIFKLEINRLVLVPLQVETAVVDLDIERGLFSFVLAFVEVPVDLFAYLTSLFLPDVEEFLALTIIPCEPIISFVIYSSLVEPSAEREGSVILAVVRLGLIGAKRRTLTGPDDGHLVIGAPFEKKCVLCDSDRNSWKSQLELSIQTLQTESLTDRL